jgi:hypothetical protein
MYKKHGILGLFLLLVVALILKPRVLFNLHKNILGRVVLIGVVLFFTSFNVTLGLLAALCLIIASNMFFMEGLTNLNGDEKSMIQPGLTVGEDKVQEGSVSVETKEKVKNAKTKADESDVTISELQEQAQEGGVDKEQIRESIESKSSKSIPTDKSTFRSEEVSANDPTTTEPFRSSYSNFKL